MKKYIMFLGDFIRDFPEEDIIKYGLDALTEYIAHIEIVLKHGKYSHFFA